MEHIFIVNIQRLKNKLWFRTFDSAWREWNDANNRVKEIITHLGGGFDSEQIITARGGTWLWSWWEKTSGEENRVIEIQKIDFGRVYDYDDIQPINPADDVDFIMMKSSEAIKSDDEEVSGSEWNNASFTPDS